MQKAIVITKEWQSVSELLGVDVGTNITLQYRTGADVVFIEGSKPDPMSVVGKLLNTRHPVVTLLNGSGEFWARTLDSHTTLIGEV